MRINGLRTLKQTTEQAIAEFGVATGERPRLFKTGLAPVDQAIGGLYPGSASIVAADQSVGKSSVALCIGLRSDVKVGVVSMEDGPDVWGTRLLAYDTGINSLDIRLGRLTPEQRAVLVEAAKDIDERYDHRLVIRYAIGCDLQEYLQAIDELVAEGCKIIVADYLQKRRQGGTDDRRNDVALTFTAGQARSAAGGAAFIGLSQVTDVKPGKMPRAYQLRETRDLANEARVIVCLCQDVARPEFLSFYLEKSTYGRQGLFWKMRRDASGTLVEMNEYLHGATLEEEMDEPNEDGF